MRRILSAILGVSLLVAAPAYAVVASVVNHTFQSAAGATGNGTALKTNAYNSLALQVIISNTATVTFEGSVNDSNWVSLVCTSIASTSGTLTTTATDAAGSGVYQCNTAGLASVRARVSAWTSGTVTVTGQLTTAVLGGGGGGGSGGSGGTQYDEDTAHTTGDKMTMAGAVRRDANTTLCDTTGDVCPLQVDATGNLKVNIITDSTTGGALDDEDASIATGKTNVALAVTMPYTFDGAAWTRTGPTISRTLSAASVNATVVKASPGAVCSILASNTNAAAAYLKLYNMTSSPANTDTPVMTLLIPGSTTGAGVVLPQVHQNCLPFATGIGFRLTTAVADNSTAAVAANEVIVHVLYK